MDKCSLNKTPEIKQEVRRELLSVEAFVWSFCKRVGKTLLLKMNEDDVNCLNSVEWTPNYLRFIIQRFFFFTKLKIVCGKFTFLWI